MAGASSRVEFVDNIALASRTPVQMYYHVMGKLLREILLLLPHIL